MLVRLCNKVVAVYQLREAEEEKKTIEEDRGHDDRFKTVEPALEPA